MAGDDTAATDLERSSQRWLAWLAREMARRQPPGEAARHPHGTGLLVLWDVLEEWFASEDFTASPVAAAMAAPPDGRGPAAHAVLARHHQATHRLLSELAEATGVQEPAAVASQLLIIVDGAIVGALLDRRPDVVVQARALTEIALRLPTG